MINKKVIMVVLNNFTNDNRVLKEAVSLQQTGMSVTIVALHEGLLAERESLNNISIHRIKLKTKNWPKNIFSHLIKYIEFNFTFFKTYKSCHIIHCNDLNTLPIGVLAKLFFIKNIKLLYDTHEYAINDVPNQSLMSIKFKFYVEKYLIKYADAIITVSESIANAYQQLYKIPKPSLVLNCPSYSDTQKKDLFRKALGIREDQTIFLYQGRLSEGRGIKMIIDAFIALSDDKNVVVFMGYGPLESYVKKQASIHRVIFFKQGVSPESLMKYTSSADYGILFYENSCLNHQYALPNKLFEYLMGKIPILSSNLLEIENFIKKHNIGVSAETNTVNDFLKAITTIKDEDYSTWTNCIEHARKFFTWEEQEKVLLSIYNKL